MIMDSLKVTTLSTGSGAVFIMDLIPWGLMCVMFCMNIIYLYYKIRKVKES